MKITMLKNAKGCNDGINSHDYIAGNKYEVSDSLAKNFVAMNVAEIIDEKAKQVHENKALDENDYKNKSAKRR